MKIMGLWNRIKSVWEADARVTKYHITPKECGLSDLQAVLQFFPSERSTGKTTALLVERMEFVPYVRRALFKELGQPSRIVGKQVWYGRSCIIIVTESNEHHWRGADAYQIDTW